jgi:hypothetical protein
VDIVYDWFMCGFAALMLFIWITPVLHTGVLGSIGLVLMGGVAVLSRDNSTFGTFERMEGVVMAMCVGVLLVIVQVLRRVVKAKKNQGSGLFTPHRRDSDWSELGAPEIQR